MNLYVVLILYVFIVQMTSVLHTQLTGEWRKDESFCCINPTCIHSSDGNSFAHTTDRGNEGEKKLYVVLILHVFIFQMMTVLHTQLIGE